MSATVHDLIIVLELFFPRDLPFRQALYVLMVVISVYPLLRLHLNQQRQPRQPARTAWYKAVLGLLAIALERGENDPASWFPQDEEGPDYAERMANDLSGMYSLLRLQPTDEALSMSSFFPHARTILCTKRLHCMFCPAGDLNIIPSLRRREDIRTVWLLDSTFHWVQADLVTAHCATCTAEYYPDRVTYRGPNRTCLQRLEFDVNHVRVSKHGIWVHRHIAICQEKALYRFHSGWSNFADWLNDCSPAATQKLTYRQSQRLFMEHFSRRLLRAHNKDAEFVCVAHPSTDRLVSSVRATIGVNSGVIPGAMTHGCTDCTHVKRYRSDLLAEGAVFGSNIDVIGVENHDDEDLNDAPQNEMPALEVPEQQVSPPVGAPWGYVRLAVMDGKTVTHRKCALDTCELPLVNYKNGRFCETHLDLRNICGIVPCGLPVRETGALTCNTQSHIDWYRQYGTRFSRLSFPGVRRVIRRQNELAENNAHSGPTLQVQLAALGNTPGNEVVHTFKAKSTYCLQTVQWACGVPIGWGKCYRSESSPQVLSILNKIWADYPDSKPSFVAYDDACDLLRHIVTQNPNDPWLETTKFIVDAWHYIGHRATDVLCRSWCNPAPVDGSQPDLVVAEEDAQGQVHQTRAFNTETAEQLNSWLSGFESQLRQMTDINYDFFIHVLLMIYGEKMEERAESKGKSLTEDFWAKVNGLD
ncbi:hypothetical protein C8J57DRAFT_1524243 [Mycena rebaudengoi]|nr:hypothetical protein C8J57DRAFT_1524243 [Mycena rebaudengoi]